MTIHHERPEDELHARRASELLTVVALIYEATGGCVGGGTIPCPVCRRADIRYSLTKHGTRRNIIARCATDGCIKFLS